MNDRPYNHVKSYLIGLQQSVKLLKEITPADETVADTEKLALMFEELQRGAATRSDEISSYLKGVRDGLEWRNNNRHLAYAYMKDCSLVLNYIIEECFD